MFAKSQKRNLALNPPEFLFIFGTTIFYGAYDMPLTACHFIYLFSEVTILLYALTGIFRELY
jgi:hypothetical protein